jgi:hypothetical protein
MRGSLAIKGPQLKPLANLLLKLDREGIVPSNIRNSNINNTEDIIIDTYENRGKEYRITTTGHTSVQSY